MIRLLLAAVFAVAGLVGAPASPAAQSMAPAPSIEQSAPTKISTRIIPPFVMRDERGQLTGFSIDLWNALSREMSGAYEFVIADSVNGILADVASGKTKFGVAAISITAEREKQFDFSQPMADGGLRIAVPAHGGAVVDPVDQFLGFVWSKSFLEILLGIVALMMVPAPIIWLIERNTGEELLTAKTKLGQLGQAMWWSICALGGQAQDMPTRVIGRVIAVPWLMFAVLFSSYFTAAVTARMTVQQLEHAIAGPDDLAGRTVATVDGAFSESWLKAKGVSTLVTGTVDDALKAVVDGKAEAAVYDAPVLAYLVSRGMKGKVRLVGHIFAHRHYGAIFPLGAPERRAFDLALLRIRESGEYKRIEDKYFGDAME